MAGRVMRLAALPLLALAFVPAPIAAQGGIPASAHRAAGEPSLVLTGNLRGVRSDATTGRYLSIEVLDVDVRIRGSVAETRMTATFRNDTDDVLEGDFRFDMPAGSVITGYALDVGPDLIEGVIAGRDRAREAYQRRVVQRIDPGLAEVTWNDRFSTRIFPIPARGSRTIRLVMTSPIDSATGYVLPMRPAGPVGRLTLAIEADDGTPPQFELPDGVRGRWQGGRFTLDSWDARIGGQLVLAPPAPQGLVVSRHANGESFFELTVPRDAAPAARAVDRPLHIFWDRSISRVDDRLEQEIDLLAALLRRQRDGAMLTLFDSGAAETLRVADEAGLRRAIAGVRYGGATSFAAIDEVAVADGALCLLVSDGRATIDARTGFAPPCPVVAVASDREVDRGWLGALADRSGGAFIELGRTSLDAALAAVAAAAQGGGGRLVDDAGGRVDAISLPGADGGRTLIGPMPERGGLRWIANGRETRFARPSPDAPLFSGAGALWASRRIAAEASDLPTGELVGLSRRYSVASPLASFIVLEQPADYVEADIPPPATYPKALRDAYAAIRAEADRRIADQQERRLGEVAAQWDDTRAWWSTKYDAQARRPRGAIDRPVPVPVPEEGDALFPPPFAPPPPPPPPPVVAPPPVSAPAARRAQEEDFADVVVTGTRIGNATLDSAVPVTVVTSQDLQQGGDTAEIGTVEVADGIEPVSWSPARPWIAAIEAAGPRWADAVDRQRLAHGALPLFWFDLAEWHWRAGRAAEARRAVETALDLPARDNQTLEIVAGRLVRYGDLDRALTLYAALADREDERPQPVRQKALVLMARAEAHRAAGRDDAARDDLRAAIALLADAVLKVRRETFRGFETLALMDANLAVQRYRALGGVDHALPARLVAMLDTDIRIVVEWNTPRTDLDLWVTQPDGERVGFSSTLSSAGGRLTGDVTNGFGPEEFLIRSAPRGRYTIEIDSFASDRTNPNGPSTVAARIIRNFGRANQSEELVDIEMDPTDDGMRRIGTIDVR